LLCGKAPHFLCAEACVVHVGMWQKVLRAKQDGCVNWCVKNTRDSWGLHPAVHVPWLLICEARAMNRRSRCVLLWFEEYKKIAGGYTLQSTCRGYSFVRHEQWTDVTGVCFYGFKSTRKRLRTTPCSAHAVATHLWGTSNEQT
jgi:hypothetical protein